ncbi:hypothetical protein CR162_20020 [Pseudoroseomonas rhizosphaerae]|uniref:Uncharacterized protein n=1 Tax=Teichococcus rhizosphaerae TaxID=1335062 RepID=A0A2C7A484_9PROT|nr:hypothetical protein [Pseudoroseomonas rhizosphaerae]PHK93160.1 hypothetical protein CR162_20020 [Pseudoroseomonas rhizosphaerae]
MSEYFPDEAARGLWEERRAVVLGHLRDASAPLAAEGLETRDIHGWALWCRLKGWTVDITTSVPFSESEHLAMLERAMRVTEFGPGRPVVKEWRVRFLPGRAVLAPEGRDALEKATEALLRFLREGPPPRLDARGRPARRPLRNPTRRAMALRAGYAKAG